MKQPENNEQDGNSKFYLSRIALNVSGLNYPIKGHRITENVKKKKKTQIHAASKTFTSANTQAQSEDMKKTLHENGNQKRGQS